MAFKAPFKVGQIVTNEDLYTAFVCGNMAVSDNLTALVIDNMTWKKLVEAYA